MNFRISGGNIIRIAFVVLGLVMIVVAFTHMDKPEEDPTTVSNEFYTQEPVSFTITPPTMEQTMICAVINGDESAGKIAGEEIGVDYKDLRWLAKIMAAESGPDWPDWAVMAIGEVVLNRVKSPDFPGSIQAVLTQLEPAIQYEPVHSQGWTDIHPTYHQVELAIRLLSGERVLEDEAVVWQALFPQGDEVVCTYYDSDLDTTTYFCAERGGEE